MNGTDNTFAVLSEAYSLARPRYPSALFEWLSEQCEQRLSAWDCATGNGQAAVGLAEHFARVEATDISVEQIAHAVPHPGVRYWVAKAESSGLPDSSVDLVTVAQALHWFDFDAFWPEVRRVARPNAFFCAWGYNWPQTTPSIDRELVAPFRTLLSPFWVPKNRILWNGYRVEDTLFPFARTEAPSYAIEVDWTLSQLVEYMKTWSAYGRIHRDPATCEAVDALFERAKRLLAPEEVLRVKTPLVVVAGRVS